MFAESAASTAQLVALSGGERGMLDRRWTLAPDRPVGQSASSARAVAGIVRRPWLHGPAPMPLRRVGDQDHRGSGPAGVCGGAPSRPFPGRSSDLDGTGMYRVYR